MELLPESIVPFFTEQFLELPGEFGYSELTMYRPRHAKCVKSFAWMTGEKE